MEYTITIQHPTEIKEETYSSFVFGFTQKEAIKNFATWLEVKQSELQINERFALCNDNGYIFKMYLQ